MAGTDDGLREFRQKAQHRQTRLFFQHRSQQSVHPCRTVVQQDACDVAGSAEAVESLQLCGQRQALTLLMATLKKPDLLLLDEHTAALDPKTAAKVLEATQRIVEKDHLTTMMITHNMRDAIAYGNRLVMMYDGHIVVDVSGEEKKHLTVEQLLNLFSQASGSDEADDKLLLS